MEISKAVQEINRNLTLLSGDGNTIGLAAALQTAVEAINDFEATTMHNVRNQMENT